MFIADVCPDATCVRGIQRWPWYQSNCTYQDFFLSPVNNASLGLLAPPVHVPGSPPAMSQTVSATLAPLIPTTQLIFAVWYNNTALKALQTQITAEAVFWAIPSFEETF